MAFIRIIFLQKIAKFHIWRFWEIYVIQNILNWGNFWLNFEFQFHIYSLCLLFHLTKRKPLKNCVIFLSPKMLFSLSRYVHFCSFPLFCPTDFKRKLKWNNYDLIKWLSWVISCNFWVTQQPLWIKASELARF